jgi:hypothetical protein
VVIEVKKSQILVMGLGVALALMSLPARADVKNVWVGVDGAT